MTKNNYYVTNIKSYCILSLFLTVQRFVLILYLRGQNYYFTLLALTLTPNGKNIYCRQFNTRLDNIESIHVFFFFLFFIFLTPAFPRLLRFNRKIALFVSWFVPCDKQSNRRHAATRRFEHCPGGKTEF